MLGQLSQVAIMFFDTLMIGKYNSLSLAAATSVNALFFGTYVFILGMIFGLKPLVAEGDAAGEHEKCRIYLVNALYMYVAAAVLLIALFELFSPYIYLLGQDAQVTELIEIYARLIFYSAVFQTISFVLLQYIEALGHSKISMYANLAGNVVNIFFNYLLIFGNFGFPELGIAGAGWGTLIAKFFMLVIPILSLMYNKKLSKFSLSAKDFIPDWEASKKLIHIGFPIGLQMLFESGFFAVAAILAGQISAAAAASHQIVLTLSVVTYMAVSGLGQGATTHLANMIGFHFFGEIKRAGTIALLLAIFVMTFASIFFIIFKAELPLIFLASDDANAAEIVSLCAGIMFYVAYYQIADGTQVVAINLLRGMQDVKVPTLISLLAYWGIGLTGSWFFGLQNGMGLAGIWLGLTIGLLSSSLLLIWRFYGQCKKLSKLGLKKQVAEL